MKRFPITKKTYWSVGIIVAVYALLQITNRTGLITNYIMQLVMLGCINIIMTISLQVINGYTGQFSIGQAGFMAIGAYVAGAITALVIPKETVASYMQIPLFLLVTLIGATAAALIAFLVGIPCLKLRGDYLAIVTLGFGEIVRTIIRMLPVVGGPRGLNNIPGYTNFTLIFIITIVIIVLVRNFVNSPHGRGCISIRENEIAADTLGINTFRYKMLGFVVAAFISGIAGSMFAHLYGFIQPDQFSMIKSTDYLIFLYLGGTASLSGSIISAMALTLLPEMLRFAPIFSEWRIAIYAVLLIIIMLRRPNGLLGGKEFPILRIKNYSTPVSGKQVK